jgi:hypothetical protein
MVSSSKGGESNVRLSSVISSSNSPVAELDLRTNEQLIRYDIQSMEVWANHVCLGMLSDVGYVYTCRWDVVSVLIRYSDNIIGSIESSYRPIKQQTAL